MTTLDRVGLEVARDVWEQHKGYDGIVEKIIAAYIGAVNTPRSSLEIPVGVYVIKLWAEADARQPFTVSLGDVDDRRRHDLLGWLPLPEAMW